MTDTAGDLVGSERDVLLHYLAKNRRAVVEVSQGLDDDSCRRVVLPSGTSLAGMLRHLTWVEAHWFEHVFLGHDTGRRDSWDPGSASRGELVEAYLAACARSDEIVRAAPELSVLAEIPNPGEPERDSLRVICAHMIEETARHAGQADAVRELIDGRVND